MADGGKLAEILAKKKAARAQARPFSREQFSAPSSGAADWNHGFSRDEDEEERRLMVTLGGSNVSHPVAASWHQPPQPEDTSGQTRNATGVVDIDLSEFDLESADKVAQGGLGVLYKAFWRGTEVAVKKPVDPRSAQDPALKEDFRREAAILGEVRHPNVVLLMGVSLRAPNLCLLLEWCGGGSLHDLLHRSKSDLSKEQRLGLAAGVASALVFLHSSSPAIIHRDIKTQNVLLDETRMVAKLCDFGLAIKLSDVGDTNPGAGTPRYMAPELFRGEACSLPSDVYAFGVTLWEMYAREQPYGAFELSELRDKVVNGERPPIPLTCPRHVGQLLKECWNADADNRPTILEVLKQIR